MTVDRVAGLFRRLMDAEKYVPRHGMEPDHDIQLRAGDAVTKLQERAGLLPREPVVAGRGGRLRFAQVGPDGRDTYLEWEV